MKDLSVRQPWAWLIAEKYKPIENRTWRCDYRGDLAIHASKGMTRGEYVDVARFLVGFGYNITLPAFDDLVCGAIVCVVDVVDCLAPRNIDAAFTAELHYGIKPLDWWDTEQSGIVLADVRSIAKPVPCAGMLGFWRVPADIERQVREQL